MHAADETAAHHHDVPQRGPSPGSSSETRSSTASTASSSTEEEDEAGAPVISSGVDLPYPGFVPVALYYFRQDRAPRSWCLRLVANPYPCLLLAPPSRCFPLSPYPSPFPPAHQDSRTCRLRVVNRPTRAPRGLDDQWVAASRRCTAYVH